METSKIRHITNSDNNKFISISRFVFCSISNNMQLHFLKETQMAGEKDFVILETKNCINLHN